MPKLVYIAHQVSGNIEENINSILRICREIHTPEIIPVAPYLVALKYLNDHIVEERTLGIAANREFFKRGLIDEVWVYGGKISSGMREEIRLSVQHHIPIICKNQDLQSDLEILLKEFRAELVKELDKTLENLRSG